MLASPLYAQCTMTTAVAPDETPLPLLSFWQDLFSSTQDIEDPDNNNSSDRETAVSSLGSHSTTDQPYPHRPQQGQNHHDSHVASSANRTARNSNYNTSAAHVPDQIIVPLSNSSTSSPTTLTAAIPTPHNATSAATSASKLPSATAATTDMIVSNNNDCKTYAQSPIARHAVDCTHGLQMRSGTDASEGSYRDSLSGLGVTPSAQCPTEAALLATLSTSRNNSHEEGAEDRTRLVLDDFSTTAERATGSATLLPSGLGPVHAAQPMQNSLTAQAAITAATPLQSNSSSNMRSAVSRDLNRSALPYAVSMQIKTVAKEPRLLLVRRDDSSKAVPAELSHPLTSGSVENVDSTTPTMAMAPTSVTLQSHERYSKDETEGAQASCPNGGGYAGTGGGKWMSSSGGECDVSNVTSRDCDVCAEPANGHYFGALVCLPCKSFFIRCTREGDPSFSTQCGGSCDVRKSGRIRCQFCRFQRCLSAGMYRKEKPETVVPGEGQALCKVCSDIANGVHFGVTTCEGCKKFFRRGLKEHRTYVCKATRMCVINPRIRNNCRFCRYQKCIGVGMSREAVKMGRPKKVRLFKPYSAEPADHKLTNEYNDNLTFRSDTQCETAECDKRDGGCSGGRGQGVGNSEYKFTLEAVCDTSYLSDDFLDAVSTSPEDDPENNADKNKSLVTVAESQPHETDHVQAVITTILSGTRDAMGTSVCSSSSACSSHSSESSARFLSNEHLALPSLICVKPNEWMREELAAGPQEVPCQSFPECAENCQWSQDQGQTILTPPCSCAFLEDACECVSPLTSCNMPSSYFANCRPHTSLMSSASQRDKQGFVLSSRQTADLIETSCEATSTAEDIQRGMPLTAWRSFSQTVGQALHAQQMTRRYQCSVADWPVSVSISTEAEARRNSYEPSVARGNNPTAWKPYLKTLTSSSKQGIEKHSGIPDDDIDELLENLSAKPTLPFKSASSANIQTILNSDLDEGKSSLGWRGSSPMTPSWLKSRAQVVGAKFVRQENQRRQSDSALDCFENAKRPKLEPNFYFSENERVRVMKGARARSDMFAGMNPSHRVIGFDSRSAESKPFLPVEELSRCDFSSGRPNKNVGLSPVYQTCSTQHFESSVPEVPPSSALFRLPASETRHDEMHWGSHESGYPKYMGFKQKKKLGDSANLPAHFGVQPIYHNYNSGDQIAVARDGNAEDIANTLCSLAGPITQNTHHNKHLLEECDAADSGTSNLTAVNNKSNPNVIMNNNKENYSALHNRPVLSTSAITVDSSATPPLPGTSSSTTHYQANAHLSLSTGTNSSTRTSSTHDTYPTKEEEVSQVFPVSFSATTAAAAAFVDVGQSCCVGKRRPDRSPFTNTRQTGTYDAGSLNAARGSGRSNVFLFETGTGHSSAGFGQDRNTTSTESSSAMTYFCSPVQDSVAGAVMLTPVRNRSNSPSQKGGSQPPSAKNGKVLHITAPLYVTTSSNVFSEDFAHVLETINQYFLSLDNSCQKNDCGVDLAADNINAYDDRWRQSECKAAENTRQGNCLSRFCPVCLDKNDESVQDAHVTPVVHAVCTRRHHRYWHCHDTSLYSVPMTASSQHTLTQVAEALGQFRHFLSSLQAQEEQAFTSSEMLLTMLSDQADTIVTIVKNFMSRLPGANTLKSEDADFLCQQLGFDSALIVLSSQAFDTESWRFRELWSWTVDPSSPLFQFNMQMLAVAGRLHALSMDNMETALLCALSLFSTDLSGLKEKEAIHDVRVSLLKCLYTYVSCKSRNQWSKVRIQRLFSLMPEVRVLSAWYRAIVSHSRLTQPPPDASS